MSATDEPMRNEFSPSEKRWWDRLKRVLKDIPPSVELNTHCDTIGISPTGTRKRSFEEHGHCDFTQSIETVRVKRFYGNTDGL